MNEAALKQASGLGGRQLKWRIARTYDADLLMKACPQHSTAERVELPVSALPLLWVGPPPGVQRTKRQDSRSAAGLTVQSLHARPEHSQTDGAVPQTAFSGVGSLSAACITKTRLQALAQGLPHQDHSPKAARLTQSWSYHSRLEALHASSEHLVQVWTPCRPPADPLRVGLRNWISCVLD